jgi:Na+-translocating ferredoxin:NAD+ oxidoreductase RnfC subunit
MKANIAIAKSACDQCSYCTDFCPRYLLGYAILPDKVMRSVGMAGEAEWGWAKLGNQCCECNLCSLYACPEDLPVMEMCIQSKVIARERPVMPELLPMTGKPHPLRDSRRVPISRLIQRLGLRKYDAHAPMTDRALEPQRVEIQLSQHLGTPAVPTVSVGDSVSAGQLIGAIPDGEFGANIHASIAGRVAFIDTGSIGIQR